MARLASSLIGQNTPFGDAAVAAGARWFSLFLVMAANATALRFALMHGLGQFDLFPFICALNRVACGTAF